MKQIQFLTELYVQILKDNSFRLSRDFYFSVFTQEYIVPEGFETDLASVPRVPVVYFLVGGRGHKAAVIHDWLYVHGVYTRADADSIYYHALRESGVGYAYAQMMYRGVRLGGGAYYKRHNNVPNAQKN